MLFYHTKRRLSSVWRKKLRSGKRRDIHVTVKLLVIPAKKAEKGGNRIKAQPLYCFSYYNFVETGTSIYDSSRIAVFSAILP